MATVIEDAVEGASFTRTQDGFSAVRTFIIKDAEGDSGNRLKLALEEGGIPLWGDAHPAIGGINVSTITATPMRGDPKTIKVVANYTVLQPGQFATGGGANGGTSIEVGAATAETISYAPRDGSEETLTVTLDALSDDEKTQNVSIRVQTPVAILRLQTGGEASPAQKALDFTGKVNGARWDPPGVGLTYKAGQVLCTRIDGFSSDGGDTYNVSYEFAIKQEGWETEIAFIDQETGKPHSKAKRGVENQGYKTFLWYKEIDFANILDNGLGAP